jgi:hypothetical protein
MLAGPGPRRARALYRTAESRRMSDSTEPVPVRTSFTADEIDTIYNDLWDGLLEPDEADARPRR